MTVVLIVLRYVDRTYYALAEVNPRSSTGKHTWEVRISVRKNKWSFGSVLILSATLSSKILKRFRTWTCMTWFFLSMKFPKQIKTFSITKLVALMSSESEDISVMIDSKKSQKFAFMLPLFVKNSDDEDIEFELESIFFEGDEQELYISSSPCSNFKDVKIRISP